MKLISRRRLSQGVLLGGLFAFGVGAACSVHADSYPNKPITLLVPFSAGSSSDLIGRVLARNLADGGINMIVENKDGGSGQIAVSTILKAPPDGYTLILGTTNVVMNMFMQQGATYSVDQFTPVAFVGTVRNALIVSSTVNAKDLPGVVALAKSKPGELMIASGGSTGIAPFLAEAFMKAAKIEAQIIPYKGSSMAIPDLQTGRTHALFGPISTGLPLVQSGKVRIVGITGSKRFSGLPEVPTFTEAGYPQLDVPSWFGVMAPAGVPAPIVERLNNAIVKALARKEVQDQLALAGVEVKTGSATEFGVFLKNNATTWDKATRDSRLRVTK